MDGCCAKTTRKSLKEIIVGSGFAAALASLIRVVHRVQVDVRSTLLRGPVARNGKSMMFFCRLHDEQCRKEAPRVSAMGRSRDRYRNDEFGKIECEKEWIMLSVEANQVNNAVYSVASKGKENFDWPFLPAYVSRET